MTARHLQVGGAVDPRRCIYVRRSFRRDDGSTVDLEDELRGRLTAMRDTAVVGPRHVGKSSLVLCVFDDLRNAGWRVGWVDLDETSEDADDYTAQFFELLSPQFGVAPPPAGTPLSVGMEQLLSDGEAPVLLVIDELDHVLGSQHRPAAATFLRSLRALQQARARQPALRPLVLCTMSLRMLSQLFDAAEVYGRPEASTSPTLELLQIGLFDPTDRTREQLEECFDTHDPGGKGNLARWILEQSGGYPLLCMALAQRLIDTNTTYSSLVDMESFFADQVRWFRGRAEAEGRMLEVSQEILESFGPDAVLAALEEYKRVVDAEQSRRKTGSTASTIAWDPGSRPQLHLSLAGLLHKTRRDDIEVATTAGPFMERYFDSAWMRERREVAQAAKASRSLQRPPGRPKVAVLITGGTIGMVERDGRVVPPPVNDPDALAREYSLVEELYDIQWVPARENLDSVDVGPSEWTEYSQAIHDLLQTDIIGVVVAHGTDTLAYTASAVAFALGRDLSKPVVFTGSQTTVDQHHGDARQNLLRACMVATQPNLPEVVILFGEHIFRATRAVKRDDRRFDAFESQLLPPLGMVSETVVLQSEMLRPSPQRAPGDPPPRLQAEFADGIVIISQTPGLRPEFLRRAIVDEDSRPTGIIIQSLGAGNIPTREPYDLSPLIRMATEELGIPVLLTSQYPIHPGNLGRYLPSRRAIDDGAIPLANMTLPALATKLSWVLGQFGPRLPRDELREKLLYNYIEELGVRDADAFEQAMGLTSD